MGPRKCAPSTPTTSYLTLQLLYISQVSRLKMSSPKKTGIQMELNVSAELAKIIGTKKGEKISRPQCVKRLWAYLKEKELQDPENKQWFAPDLPWLRSLEMRRSSASACPNT